MVLMGGWLKNGEEDEVICELNIYKGSSTMVRLILNKENNRLSLYLRSLVNYLERSREACVIKICNLFNAYFDYWKFYVNPNGNLEARYDFYLPIDEEKIGDIAYEIYQHLKVILDDYYILFMKAIYTDEKLELDLNNLFATYIRLKEIPNRIQYDNEE